jgi:hypothetical protein
LLECPTKRRNKQCIFGLNFIFPKSRSERGAGTCFVPTLPFSPKLLLYELAVVLLLLLLLMGGCSALCRVEDFFKHSKR